MKPTRTTDPQSRYVRVVHANAETTLLHYRLGAGDRTILIMAGIHGREHGGIQAGYELLDRLTECRMRGRVDILPVCNPMAYNAESRLTPGTDRDMARSFTPDPPSSMTEALSHAVLSLAQEATVVLNLHSAGDARYLPHVMYYREQDAEFAASLGFPFVIRRGSPETLKHHISSRMRPDQRTVTLELGGGIVAYPRDVSLGVDRIWAFLGRIGFLQHGDYERPPTPSDMVWRKDVRQFVRAPGGGAFYTQARLGTDFDAGEVFGFWVGLEDLRPRPLVAPTTGKLIYLRTRNRVPAGVNVAMFLPMPRRKPDQPLH